MKLLKLAALVIVMCFITTGCNISSDSPENLLNDNIVYNQGKDKLYTFVNQSLDGTSLLLPGNASEVGEINELDSGIIAFQKKQDVNTGINEVGFLLMSEDNETYTLEDSYLQEGEDIEYANFCDLNNDDNDEIVLLINKNKVTTMHVYSIVNNKIKLVSSVQPTWLNNHKNYINTKLKIGFLNDDLMLDILMMNLDIKSGKMYATVINYDKNYKMKISNSVEFTEVSNITGLYMTAGKVYSNKKGVILSVPTTIRDSGYYTQILTLNDNKLTKVFEKDNTILNSYYVPVKDTNLDGVLDIPVLINNKIDGFTASSSSSSLISWESWNNKTGSDAKTVFIIQVYYNYKNNFKFLIPNNLANKLYVQKSIVGENPYYTFYYYDKKPVEIFQIGVSEKNIVEDAKSAPKLETILAETDNNYYQLIIKDKEIFEKYNLTIEGMKESFSIIYQ